MSHKFTTGLLSALILIALALLLNAALAANPNPSPTSGNEQQRQAQEQSTGSASLLNETPLPVATATANNQTNASNNEAGERPDWFWPPQWSNWALVIVAAWAAYVAIRTLKAMERQVEVQESAVFQVQSAILHVIRSEVIENGKKVKTTVHNYGTTPATVLRISVRACYFRDFPEVPTYKKPSGYGTGFMVWPQRDETFECGIEREADGKLFVVYGYVVFEDVFSRRFKLGFGALQNNTEPTNFIRLSLRPYTYLEELGKDDN